MPDCVTTLGIVCAAHFSHNLAVPPPTLLSPLFDGGLHCFATLAVNLGIQPLFFVIALVLLLLPLLPAI